MSPAQPACALSIAAAARSSAAAVRLLLTPMGTLGSARPPVLMITGASAGVGRATAIAFARQGASVGLLARGSAGLDGALRDVEEAGGRGLICEADVADAEAVENAAAEVESAFGPIDVWINNAMASVFSPIHEMTAAEFKRVTEVTYLGVVHGTLAALKRMRPRDRGVIIQVGSALAYRGIPLQSAYCAAKHAVQGFCESLRAELLHDGKHVRITMVQLPALNTPQFDWVKSRLPGRAQPVPPIFQPEVAAEAIVRAAHHPRRELFVGYPTWLAIVGNSLVPGMVDRYLARNGYHSQQTDEAEDPDRPHNLWRPVDDDRDVGAHGRFDERARTRSWAPSAVTGRFTVALGAGLVGLAAGLALASLPGRRT
jgi:NAD(P)-dependent dehydrogenase (short-subunit alcohol dehydrogenase family)